MEERFLTSLADYIRFRLDPRLVGETGNAHHPYLAFRIIDDGRARNQMKGRREKPGVFLEGAPTRKATARCKRILAHSHKNGRHLSKVTPCSYRNPLGMRRAAATHSPVKGTSANCATSTISTRQLRGLYHFDN